MKINCWEYKKCGMEPGGVNEHKLGPCPAATETMVDGIYGGKNGGRCCWAIAGTLCGGKVRGTIAQKIKNCRKCDFFQLVIKEGVK